MQTELDDILTEQDFERISDLIHRTCGINLHDGKRELVRARIARDLRATGKSNAREYLDWVMADQSGKAFHDLVDSLSTNLTSFFREDSHFEYLSRTFLSAMMQRKVTEGSRRIRVWSAGCSSGEEPYTMAMCILEATGNANWDVKILATDVSTRMLRTARAGFYEQARMNNVPADLRARYFSVNRMEGRVVYEVSPALREVVCFNYLNLMEPWPFSGPFDFIFCRNVMIYFDKPTQQKLVTRFYDCLQKGGLLFTGHSESLTGIAHRFEYVQPTIYRR